MCMLHYDQITTMNQMIVKKNRRKLSLIHCPFTQTSHKAALQRLLVVSYPRTIMLNRPAEIRHRVPIPIFLDSFLNFYGIILPLPHLGLRAFSENGPSVSRGNAL